MIDPDTAIDVLWELGRSGGRLSVDDPRAVGGNPPRWWSAAAADSWVTT